jgi:hypothetical protein
VVHYIFFCCCLGLSALGGLIDLLYLLYRFGRHAHVDHLFVSEEYHGLNGMRFEDAYDIFPIRSNPILFEHKSNGIDELIGQYGKIDMTFSAIFWYTLHDI